MSLPLNAVCPVCGGDGGQYDPPDGVRAPVERYHRCEDCGGSGITKATAVGGDAMVSGEKGDA